RCGEGLSYLKRDMPIDDEAALAQLLPGRWVVKATNFPAWLGDRRDAIFEYDLVRDQPLTVADRVTYTDADGKSKTVAGTGKWNGRGFTSRLRGTGRLFATSRWEVAGAGQGLLVIRFEESSATPSGVDVLIAEGVEV